MFDDLPTVYANFASKAEVLRRAIEVALAGDDEAIAVADRPTALWVHEAETGEELLARYAVMIGEMAARVAPIYSVLVAAADAEPELAALLKTFGPSVCVPQGRSRAVCDREVVYPRVAPSARRAM